MFSAPRVEGEIAAANDQISLSHFFIQFMVPGAGLEPARSITPRDFKSLVSTNFTTRANPYASRKELGSDDIYYIKFDRRA